VDKPIFLEAVGFYGPYRYEKSHYAVSLDFCFINEKQDEISYFKQTSLELFSSDAINKVSLEEPVYIPAYKKLVIKFELNVS